MGKMKALMPTEPEPAAPAGPPAGPDDSQWIVGNWRGIEQHTCSICQRDTLGGIKAAREMKAACPRCGPPPEITSTADILVADKWGHEKLPKE